MDPESVAGTTASVLDYSTVTRAYCMTEFYCKKGENINNGKENAELLSKVISEDAGLETGRASRTSTGPRESKLRCINYFLHSDTLGAQELKGISQHVNQSYYIQGVKAKLFVLLFLSLLVCGYLLKQLETTFVVNHNFKISPSARCVSDSNAICKGNRYFNKDYSSLTNILYLCVYLQVKFVLLSHILWVLCCTFDRLSSAN
jgi:hypothetical protein